jgi:alpha-galactosidase
MRTKLNTIAAFLPVILALTGTLAMASSASASTPVAARPPMGYNPWYEYGVNATEAAVLQQAHLLVSTGLAAAGYNYVNLDDGWMAAKRGASGALTWNTTRFPQGIPWLASQVHSLGLKFGIYAAIGSRTCKNLPGSYGHYTQDAQTFAQWGIDFAKVDNCGGLPAGTSVTTLSADFKAFGAALRAANPAIVFSEELPITYIGTSNFVPTVKSSASFANMWRVTSDESPLRSAAATILGHLAADLHLHAFAGPGHWNDLDLLVTGIPKFGWSLAQARSQLSVWSEEASPLLLSTNISALTAGELAALKNPYVLAIDQSGAQAPKSVMSAHIEALMKPDPQGGVAVLLANLGTGAGSGHFKLSQFGLTTSRGSGYNVWTGAMNTFSGVSITLGAGQTELLILKAA